MSKEIKVLVSGNTTSCCQLRIKFKGNEYSEFVCGIDVEERHVLTTYGHIWAYSILGLVEDIARAHKDEYEFRDTDRIEYLEVCDDSGNLELDWGICHEQLMSNKNALDRLTLNDVEQGWNSGWNGVIKI